MKRVVVTGLGLVSPLGVRVDSAWDKLISGVSGVKKIDTFDCSDLPSKIAGIVPRIDLNHDGFDDEDCLNLLAHLNSKELNRIGEFIAYSMVAADFAFKDLGWKPETFKEQCRSAVIVGSGIGGLDKIDTTSNDLHTKGPRRVSPFFIPSSLINLASGNIAIRHSLRGPTHSVVTACASGTHAIGDAFNMIRNDYADLVVAGATEAAVCRIGVAGFSAAKALSTSYNDSPAEASRPWDNGRDGFVISEGAAVLILEEYEHAKSRGAKIYAEIVGFGMSGDAHHITAPEPNGDGAFRSMECALRIAGVNPSEVDYINAHGTSTVPGDVAELNAVERLFAGNTKLCMSSTKSSIGHALGAAGAIEALFCIKAINSSIMPPTLNLHDQCQETFVDLLPCKSKEKKLKYVISNSFGFGGTNATLVFKRFE